MKKSEEKKSDGKRSDGKRSDGKRSEGDILDELMYEDFDDDDNQSSEY